MHDRIKTIRINLIVVSVTLLTIFLVSMTGNAAERQFKSQGKIIFDNRTGDAADDVIFDATDFDRLAFTCR